MLRDYAFQELSDFDREVYQLVVPQEHFLNRALTMLPWDEFSDVLVPYYSVDQGRPALKPVQMLKLEYFLDPKKQYPFSKTARISAASSS